MRRKHQATIDRLARLHPGTHWSDVESLLTDEFGADRYEGSGSTVTFVIDGIKLTVDRPHPRRECGRGLVKRVWSYLQTTGRV